MIFDWGVQYTVGKIFFGKYKIVPLHVPKRLDLKKI
jgi:hypothetical protein